MTTESCLDPKVDNQNIRLKFKCPSLNKIKTNVQQSNVTASNNSNVEAVTVFDNLYDEKYTAVIH